MSGGNVAASSSSPRGTGTECRKFVPNIFNKSKCSSCFKQREEHSAEALESNRATRKVSKCGYLFVAPGWDFSNPLNRTKRWQRRWFVLYDDGELTYSVDEHPETVPQSRIDMTRVLEVAAAEDVTGHPYSLAITSPDGVTFVKGTCREETRWWADVLQVYSRNKGRHKRNATFPGGQTTIIQVPPTIRSNTPNPPRPRFNSCRTESRNPTSVWSSESVPGYSKNPQVSSSQTCISNNSINGTSISCINENGTSLSRTSIVSPLRNSTLENPNVYNYGTSPSVTINGTIVQQSGGSVLMNSEKPPMVPCVNEVARSYRDQPASSASPPTRDKLCAEDKAKRRMNQQNERSSTVDTVDQLDDEPCRRIMLEHEREREGKLRDIAVSLTQPRVRRSNKTRMSEPTRDVIDAINPVHQDKLVRGDPDGCGLDISGSRYSPTSELRVDLPAEDLLNIKKGWLMKQGLNKEWNKHWFVLRGCGLMYYRDPTTEDKGIMDGVIDLNTVTAVTSVQVGRNYGFQTVTWDDRGTTVFSAVTAGIRSSWISAIRRAANLHDAADNSNGDDDTGILCSKSNQDDSKSQSPTVSINDRDKESGIPPSTPLTPRSVLFSSDEEYRTASEGGRRESGDWSEIPVTPPLTRNIDWHMKLSNWSDTSNHEWSELPPSPPLTRTALSRVKARSRSSSRSRVYKRSKSSPPNSRRSTLDSVHSEDLMMACCELDEDKSHPNTSKNNENPLIVDLLDSQVNTIFRDEMDQNDHPTSLIVIIERQENELESLKSQLANAKTELTNTERELSRLRQHKAEAAIRENKIEELLNTIKRTEQQRKKDLDDFEKIKKIYSREKEVIECKLLETQTILRETTDRCEMLSSELSSSHLTVEHLQKDISSLSNKLSEGIEENERIYERIRELEGKNSLSASRERAGKNFDSLSDLTNVDLYIDFSDSDKERIIEEFHELRDRFEKAILEIRAMRKELREAHTTQDALELELFAYKQDNARIVEANQSQVQLMAARIQDLTNKLASSEKQMRQLKQKLAKVETRDKRRSVSLKGRESFSISQEVEDKLLDLENKIAAIELDRIKNSASTSQNSKESKIQNVKKDRKIIRENKVLDRTRLRRKSLDSATSSEPLKVLIRLSTLEGKVASVSSERENLLQSDIEKDSSECSELSTCSNSEISMEIFMRLKKLERALSKSKRRLDKCLGSTQIEEKAERCLREVNDILESCFDCSKKSQINSQLSESIGIVVSKLETILKDKIMELTCKRRKLQENNQLDDNAKLHLLAERIAYEFVVMRQLKSAINHDKSIERSNIIGELVETSQLISTLKCKINGTKPKIYQNINCYMQYLTKVLANKLVLVGGKAQKLDKINDDYDIEIDSAKLECKEFLMKKQKQVNDLMVKYKETKLKELAEALAAETLNLSGQDSDSSKSSIQSASSTNKLLEDKRIREAWALAQEAVNKELVQTEVSHIMLKCAQMYEQNMPSVTDICLNFESFSTFNLESWNDQVQVKLRREMEYSIEELSAIYEESLEKMKKIRTPISFDSRQLLTDYADIIAQKALIDARISLLQGDEDSSLQSRVNLTGQTFITNLIKTEDLLLGVIDDNYIENPILDAEYVYLYQQFSRECEEKIQTVAKKSKNFNTIVQSLLLLEDDLIELGKSLKDKMENLNEFEEKSLSKFNTSLTDWSHICDKCRQLREHIKRLNDYVKNIACKQCDLLQKSIKTMNIEHNEELRELKRNQELNIMEIKGEMDNQRNSLTSQYEQEASSLRERARKLEQRLNIMDTEHSAHVNDLRVAYQRSINAELDTDAETRKRYKEEIKQLRGLCEKGLIAMENSHRRIIAEMEEKHRQELENLRIEKEQALSEETQATLAALDAMRKAHEHEVQKEITKFKQEFLKQVQAREDIGVLHKEHEEEMEEIKQEILSLSAKYSSKCVETAALEEKVGLLTKQVAQSQQHIMQLDARNKQLKAHLVFETNEGGLAEKREEIHRLQQQLKHGEEPTIMSKSKISPQHKCQDVNNERSIRGGGGGGGGDKMTQLPQRITNLRGLKKTNSEDKSLSVNYLWDSIQPRNSQQHQYQELMRSPSVKWSGRICRSLPQTPILGYQNSLYPPLTSVGMVAERKKRFEL